MGRNALAARWLGRTPARPRHALGRALTAAAISLVIAGSTGCTNDGSSDGPTFTPPTQADTNTTAMLLTTLAAPTTTPAPTLRPVPPEAMAQTPEGAVAFLQWWVDMYNYVELTGETQLVSDNSEASCEFCTNAIQRIRPIYDAGGRIERDGPTVFMEVVPGPVDENGYTVISFKGTSEVTRAIDAQGGTLYEAPAEPTPRSGLAGLQWSDQWSVTEIGNEGI